MALEQKKLSTLIDKLIPEHIATKYPGTANFLKRYYESLEQANGVVELTSNILGYSDVDDGKLVAEFVTENKNQFISGFPQSIQSDAIFVIKQIKDFYQSKGNQDSFRFLFRLLYGKEIDFYYPKVDMLRVSDGKWTEPIQLFFDRGSLTVNSIYDTWVGSIVTDGKAFGTVISVQELSNPRTGNLSALMLLTQATGTFNNSDTYSDSGSFADGVKTSWGKAELGQFFAYKSGTNNIDIKINGVLQASGTDFTETDNFNFVFASAPNAGSIIDVVAYDVIDYFATVQNTGVTQNTFNATDFGAGFSYNPANSIDIFVAGNIVSPSNLNTTSGNSITFSSGFEPNVGEQIVVHVYDGKTLFSNDPNISDTFHLSLENKLPGYWENEDGKISSNKKIQDSFYYQDFSYEIKSELSKNEWILDVENLVHPIGFQPFGKVSDVFPVSNTTATISDIIYLVIIWSLHSNIAITIKSANSELFYSAEIFRLQKYQFQAQLGTRLINSLFPKNDVVYAQTDKVNPFYSRETYPTLDTRILDNVAHYIKTYSDTFTAINTNTVAPINVGIGEMSLLDRVNPVARQKTGSLKVSSSLANFGYLPESSVDILNNDFILLENGTDTIMEEFGKQSSITAELTQSNTIFADENGLDTILLENGLDLLSSNDNINQY